MERELTLLCEAVRRAGLRAMELRRDGFETFIKPDRSPVTTADLAVDRMLREALLAAFPDDGWLSEETADDPIRLEKKRVWVVDPIDGTKYFMRGESQFAVSAALVQEGTVVAGAVFNPATDELFGAARGLGTRLNGVRVPVPPPAGERLVVLVNPPALERGTFAAYAPHADCRPMGSIAYTLALVAAGRADATVNFERLSEWDVAAGVLLVQEAGGVAAGGGGEPLRFNRPDPGLRGVLAAGPGRWPLVEALLARVGRGGRGA